VLEITWTSKAEATWGEMRELAVRDDDGIEARAGCDQAGSERTLRMKGALERAGSRIGGDGESETTTVGETVGKA
jgi:hypothetical protein